MISDAGNPRNPRVFLADRPICDAISLGIPISETRGSMILDIGAQSTEVSVIAGGQVIVSDSIAIGGQQLSDAIAGEIRRRKNLLIGNRTARRLKISLSTFLSSQGEERVVTGVDTLTGLPRQDVVTSEFVSLAVTEEMRKGAEAMRTFLERTPPQISGNIFNEGIYLTGGTARIPGIERYLCRIIGCRINLGKDYEFSTIRGLEEMMQNKELRKWAYSVKDKR
ncbi:MAG: rod shape-determining protein, partial [Lachnospiraceae bacterium]|nr:rod shape-determining protein [Lachnospiraceae bacterium]